MKIIAGPCSINEKNLEEVYEMAEIKVDNLKGKKQKAIFGTRIVGLKSRTALNPTGTGMGIDYPILMENIEILEKGGSSADFLTPPSVQMGKEIVRKTGMMIATEVMMPEIQIPSYEKSIPDGRLLLWNPSVNQLGWPIISMARAAKNRHWNIGIKNAKWLGTSYQSAINSKDTSVSGLETTWTGLAHYALESKLEKNNLILIHRGVDVPEKGKYRNIPVHEVARKVKLTTGAKLYFDPSHSCGPDLRDQIVSHTISAMRMKDENGGWLYDGALIEAGTSDTDTKQHITINELKVLAQELAKFRELESSPETIQNREKVIYNWVYQ